MRHKKIKMEVERKGVGRERRWRGIECSEVKSSHFERTTFLPLFNFLQSKGLVRFLDSLCSHCFGRKLGEKPFSSQTIFSLLPTILHTIKEQQVLPFQEEIHEAGCDHEEEPDVLLILLSGNPIILSLTLVVRIG